MIVIANGGPMPTGPKGEKRPADVIGNAVKIMRIATGEIDDTVAKSGASQERASKGGKARAAQLKSEDRSEIARKASAARWNKK
jgi:hypothetical protein